MSTVRQLLEHKNRPEIHSIAPDRTTYEALQIMADHEIGAVAVLDGQGNLQGLLTERDYARRIVLEGKKSRHTPVRDTMRTKLSPVHPDTSIRECMSLMTRNKERYLPVMEGSRLIGLVSIGDVIKTMLIEQESNVEHLTRYITGGDYGFQ